MDRRIWKRVLPALLSLVLACLSGAASAGEWQSFHVEGTNERNTPPLDYWVYVPDGDTEGLPLVLFLHGAGEKGSGALTYSLPLYIIEGSVPEPEALLVVPQLPGNLRRWAFAENSVVLAVDETISAFGADPSALTLTGFSLGGMGTWNLSKIARGKFSRILCVCGTISTWVPTEFFTGCQLKIITGKYDGSVDAKEEQIYAESARRDGIDAEWIEYPSNHADTCSLVFKDMEILTWLRLYKEKEEAP